MYKGMEQGNSVRLQTMRDGHCISKDQVWYNWSSRGYLGHTQRLGSPTRLSDKYNSIYKIILKTTLI